MPVPRLHLPHTALLVVDVQEKLVPVMHEADRLVAQVGRLIDGAHALGVPVLATEQYRRGLGVSVPPIAQRLTSAACVHEKLKFSGCIEPIRTELTSRGIRGVIVCGIEAHVCVMQTCLDLLDAGYLAAIAVDATTSRRPADRDVALQRLVQAGVLPVTVESALLELVHEAGGDRFKSVLGLIK